MDAHELQRIRATPLESVLEGFGAQRDPKDLKHNWKLADSRITVTGDKFFDHNAEKGGGGALDLTMHLMGYDFADPSRQAFRAAVQWLGASERVAQAAVVQERRHVDPASITSVSIKQEPPVPDPSRLPRVRHYLAAVRGIPAELVDKVIEQGRVFADVKGNAVFRLYDAEGKEVGYEKRGTYEDKPFKGVYGAKGLFAVGSRSAGVAAFVESAIEALSYKALRPDVLAISTTGNAIELPQKVAQGLIARGVEVVAAFNADKDGDQFSKRFIERLGGAALRDRPDERLGKDWNLVLRATRASAPQDRADQFEVTR
jgi:Protein of unknown function (DUF3991)/Toprim-like